MIPDPIFLNIHMYGIMIAIGVLCAFATLSVVAKKKSIDGKFTDFVFYNGLASIAVGFGSAALFQAVYDYIENPSAGFHFNGGLDFSNCGYFVSQYCCRNDERQFKNISRF